MAKLKDKMYNRVIEGQLELSEAEKNEQSEEALSAVNNVVDEYSEGLFDGLRGLTEGCVDLQRGASKVWLRSDVMDEDNYGSDMKSGDIVIDDNDNVGIIRSISFTEENELEYLELYARIGTMTRDIIYDIEQVEKWSSVEGEVGTKLYLHNVHLSSAPNAFDFKFLTNSKDAITTVNDLIGFLDSNTYSVISTSKGLYYGYRKVGGGGQYFGFYIQTIFENNSTLEFSETNDMLSWSITDTVTQL